MKRILLSLSVAALVSAAGVSLAADYDNTAPTSPNNLGSPTSPDNNPGSPSTLQSPSMTSPGAPGVTGGTLVRLEKGEGWGTDDIYATPIEIVINGQKTVITREPGQVNIMRGTSPRDLKIEVRSPDGKSLERCAKVEVAGNGGSSTDTVSQVALTIGKKDGKLVCQKAMVTTASSTGNNIGM